MKQFGGAVVGHLLDGDPLPLQPDGFLCIGAHGVLKDNLGRYFALASADAT